jgi:hypothetical protein
MEVAWGVFGKLIETIKVVSPNENVPWRIGSLHQIQWTQSLGRAAKFRVELDRDNDGSYEKLMAAAAPVDSAIRSSFGWECDRATLHRGSRARLVDRRSRSH